jgi:hypothetical protein
MFSTPPIFLNSLELPFATNTEVRFIIQIGIRDDDYANGANSSSNMVASCLANQVLNALNIPYNPISAVNFFKASKKAFN